MCEKFLSLWDWLGQIPDPRDPSGRRYALQSVLALIMAGLLNGKTSLRAISKWGRELSRAQLLQLNFRRHSPSQTAMHYLLVRMDPKEIERALRRWISGTFLEKWFTEELEKLSAKDFKKIFSDEYAALKVLSGYCDLISEAVHRMTKEMKTADLTVRLESLKELLNRMPIQLSQLSAAK
jgi:hypothetical protein